MNRRESGYPDYLFAYYLKLKEDGSDALAKIMLIESANLGCKDALQTARDEGLDIRPLIRYERKLVKSLKEEIYLYSGKDFKTETKKTKPPKERLVDAQTKEFADTLIALKREWVSAGRPPYFSNFAISSIRHGWNVGRMPLDGLELEAVPKMDRESITKLLLDRKSSQFWSSSGDSILSFFGWAFQGPLHMMVFTIGMMIMLSMLIQLLPEREQTPEQIENRLYEEWKTLERERDFWLKSTHKMMDKNDTTTAWSSVQKANSYQEQLEVAKRQYYEYKRQRESNE